MPISTCGFYNVWPQLCPLSPQNSGKDGKKVHDHLQVGARVLTFCLTSVKTRRLYNVGVIAGPRFKPGLLWAGACLVLSTSKSDLFSPSGLVCRHGGTVVNSRTLAVETGGQPEIQSELQASMGWTEKKKNLSFFFFLFLRGNLTSWTSWRQILALCTSYRWLGTVQKDATHWRIVRSSHTSTGWPLTYGCDGLLLWWWPSNSLDRKEKVRQVHFCWTSWLFSSLRV